MKEQAARKRKMAQDTQAGEEEVIALSPSLLHLPTQLCSWLQDNPIAHINLLRIDWQGFPSLDRLVGFPSPSSDMEANPILSFSFLPQTRS